MQMSGQQTESNWAIIFVVKNLSRVIDV